MRLIVRYHTGKGKFIHFPHLFNLVLVKTHINQVAWDTQAQQRSGISGEEKGKKTKIKASRTVSVYNIAKTRTKYCREILLSIIREP